MSPLSFYVRHYGSQYFSGLNKKENAANKSSVHLDHCCCTLFKLMQEIINYDLQNDLTRKQIQPPKGCQ